MDSRFDGSEASFSSMAARNTEFDPTTGSLAPATSQRSPGAGTTKDRGPGTAPRREGFRRTRASFQVGGCTQSSWGRRRDRSKPSRGIEESSPASSASFNTRQGDAVRKFPGTGQEEGGRGQRVGFASPERVGTIERRGCRRGATVGDTSSRVGAPPSLQSFQSTCLQRWRGCVLSWSSCRRRRKMVVPKSRPISRPVVSSTIQFQQWRCRRYARS